MKILKTARKSVEKQQTVCYNFKVVKSKDAMTIFGTTFEGKHPRKHLMLKEISEHMNKLRQIRIFVADIYGACK